MRMGSLATVQVRTLRRNASAENSWRAQKSPKRPVPTPSIKTIPANNVPDEAAEGSLEDRN
jgi:hypothetical protein